jgi:hypothetical protein
LERELNMLDSSMEMLHLEEELAIVRDHVIVGAFAERQISDVAIQRRVRLVVDVVVVVVVVPPTSVPREPLVAPRVIRAVSRVFPSRLVFDSAPSSLLRRQVAIRGPAPPAKDSPLWMIPGAVEGWHCFVGGG